MEERYPLIEMLVYYHQHSGEMDRFRENPNEAMDRFGIEGEDRGAIYRALEGDFDELDGRLRGLLPLDQFPSTIGGWNRMLVFW